MAAGVGPGLFTVGLVAAQDFQPADGSSLVPTGTPKATPIGPEAARPEASPRPGVAQPQEQKPANGTPLPDDAQAPANPLETSDPNLITLSAFSEPVQLSALVNLVAATLGINVTIVDSLDGTVAFNAAVPVKKSELLNLLDALLEQHGWTITLDDTINWYTVRKVSDIPVNFDGGIVTTRIFSTPNLRPSAVQQAIAGQLGGGGGGGQPGMPGAGGTGKLQPIDELGIIIVTDTPRKLVVIGDLISKILQEWGRAQFIRLELTHVAAPTARDRILQLLGQSTPGGGGDPNQMAQFQAQRAAMAAAGGGGAGGGALDNIGSRLTVDPLSNALIFRGLPDEIDQVKSILAVIDMPGKLKPKRFFAGSAAAQIADMARQRGLGEVTTISDPNSQNINNPNFAGQPQFNNNRAAFGTVGGTGNSLVGGPVMVVDEANGQIIYYGTDEQQDQLALLIEQLDTGSERIVIREYKLKNSDAVDVTDVINGLLYNQTPVGSSDLLGDSSGFGGDGFGSFGNPGGFGGTGLSNRGGFGGSRFQNDANRARRSGGSFANINNNPAVPGSAPIGLSDGLEIDARNAFVIADTKNNQILVKAPAGAQKDFAKLIERLDLRRPQVYLECKIIAVSMSDDMRLAVETQLINAAGLGGLVQTNFGLTTAGAGITDRRNPVAGLQGLTAALLENKYVPIVINALQTKTDARILSSPSLLVDDNEEATIATVDQEPYTTTQTSVGNNNLTGFGGYAEAGTTLLIKPHISEDGYIRLQYKAELSSFTGVGTNGSPPPKQTNTVESDNITVPGDSTVIVGGINIDTKRKTKIQVPLLGDIPYIGHLFMDYNRTGRTTTLYIFVTPRILREPNFADLRLLTMGPQAASRLAPDVPPLTATAIDINLVSLENLNSVRTPPPAAPLFPLREKNPESAPPSPESKKPSNPAGEAPPQDSQR